MSIDLYEERRRLRLFSHCRSLERAVTFSGRKALPVSDSSSVVALRIIQIIEDFDITPMSRLGIYCSGLAYMYAPKNDDNTSRAKIYMNKALELSERQDVRHNVEDREIFDSLVQLTKG